MDRSWMAGICAAGFALAPAAHAALSAEPADFFDAGGAAQGAVTLRSAAAAVSTFDIRLEAPSPALLRDLQRTNAGGVEKALQIGFGRPVDFDSSALTWLPAADGGLVARVSVTSPQAVALRMSFTFDAFPPGAELRFFGSANPAHVMGPVGLAQARLADGVYWSPVTDGTTITAEIYLPAGVPAGAMRFQLPEISHLVANAATAAKLKIGESESCNRDVACVANPSKGLLDAAKSVAKMIYQKGGKGWLCTGTLLSDTDNNTAKPYFYTANHCINMQIVASTLNTFWFYETPTCGGSSTPNMQQRAGGATLLVTDGATDASLLLLDEPPPSGVVFSGWDASKVGEGTQVVALHHPAGDVKKESEGLFDNYGVNADGRGSFINVRWSVGSTQGGSSGSGLFVQNGPAYYLRGGLYGGLASCSNPQLTDNYSRLDVIFPQMKKYLDPVTEKVTLVEFYNPKLDHYFITWIGEEITALSVGDTPGWVRTGLTFDAYPSAVAGTSSVCRIYIPPAKGDGHFYGRDKAECDTAMARNPSFVMESATFFYAFPTSGGTCAAGLKPIYRVYSNRADANHRYLTTKAERDTMVAKGWVAEGDGPDAVTMCAP